MDRKKYFFFFILSPVYLKYLQPFMHSLITSLSFSPIIRKGLNIPFTPWNTSLLRNIPFVIQRIMDSEAATLTTCCHSRFFLWYFTRVHFCQYSPVPLTPLKKQNFLSNRFFLCVITFYTLYRLKFPIIIYLKICKIIFYLCSIISIISSCSIIFYSVFNILHLVFISKNLLLVIRIDKKSPFSSPPGLQLTNVYHRWSNRVATTRGYT